MNHASRVAARRRSVWYSAGEGDADAFDRLVDQQISAADWPYAMSIAEGRVPVYDGDALPLEAGARLDLTAEWVRAFRTGPGVIVIRDALAPGVVDRASAVFEELIDRERAAGTGGGDHFAKPGANDRVWNAAQKHCLADPEGFAAYYACDALALASLAWLGPGYQVTAQVNRVNPGGAAQVPHRDYHLGFMSAERAAEWPALAHALSPALTLQGAISHGDIGVEAGPTMLLPFSQLAPDGYVSFHQPAYRAVFARRHLQLPMGKGDALFFNPAVMHGAGENRTPDQPRLVNLFQVSSAFGRAIEAVDRAAMVRALFPVLANVTGQARENVISAAAEGYPFPTNLDRNPPVGGLAPQSQADLLRGALDAGWEVARLDAALDAIDQKNCP